MLYLWKRRLWKDNVLFWKWRSLFYCNWWIFSPLHHFQFYFISFFHPLTPYSLFAVRENVVTRRIIKGCVSRSICSVSTGVIPTDLGPNYIEFDCCEGNLCNGFSVLMTAMWIALAFTAVAVLVTCLRAKLSSSSSGLETSRPGVSMTWKSIFHPFQWWWVVSSPAAYCFDPCKSPFNCTHLTLLYWFSYSMALLCWLFRTRSHFVTLILHSLFSLWSQAMTLW